MLQNWNTLITRKRCEAENLFDHIYIWAAANHLTLNFQHAKQD